MKKLNKRFATYVPVFIRGLIVATVLLCVWVLTVSVGAGVLGVRGDVWVYDGRWLYIERENGYKATTQWLESRTGESYAEMSVPMSEHSRISGSYSGDLYVLDDTGLWFDDASFGSGAIIGAGTLRFEGGRVYTGGVQATGSVITGPDCEVYVYEELKADTLDCSGGVISAGIVSAGRIWLEDGAELNVSLDVTADLYTQHGGCVTIGGNLLCYGLEGERSIMLLPCGVCETSLVVGGSIILKSGATESFGFDYFTADGFDEASLYSLFQLRRGRAVNLLHIAGAPPDLRFGVQVQSGALVLERVTAVMF